MNGEQASVAKRISFGNFQMPRNAANAQNLPERVIEEEICIEEEEKITTSATKQEDVITSVAAEQAPKEISTVLHMKNVPERQPSIIVTQHLTDEVDFERDLGMKADDKKSTGQSSPLLKDPINDPSNMR